MGVYSERVSVWWWHGSDGMRVMLVGVVNVTGCFNTSFCKQGVNIDFEWASLRIYPTWISFSSTATVLIPDICGES